MIGPTMIPTDHIDIAEPRSCGAYMSSITACDNGTKAAPNTPWIIRNATICSSDCAAPQNMLATVNPAMDSRNSRRRPNRPDSHPTAGVMIAAAIK